MATRKIDFFASYYSKLSGRERIYFNVTKKNFLLNPELYIKELFGGAISIHKKNIGDYDKIHNEVVGKQKIYTKQRVDEDQINNQYVENHLWKILRTNVSYIIGRPIQYSNRTSDTKDDMIYLSNYLADMKKHKNDIDVVSDCIEYGVGYRMSLPRLDLYDKKTESCIKDYHLDPRLVFLCYGEETRNEVLFACVIEKVYDLEKKNKVDQYLIYFTDEQENCYSFRINEKAETIAPIQKETYKHLPIFEYSINKYRISPIEIILPLQDAINRLLSLEIDDVEQFVQAFLVFVNQDVDLETEEGRNIWGQKVSVFRKTRTILLNSQVENLPADLKQLVNQLDHTSLSILYERLKNAAYDITSTPQPSGNVTSGGDTSGARLLGNGWESALFEAELNTSYMKDCERIWLKFFIDENKNSQTEINEISANEIEIKYDINMSDNMLVKTQSISNLYNANMPKELILTAVNILGDVQKSSKMWQEYDDKVKEENAKRDNSNGTQIESIASQNANLDGIKTIKKD